VNRTFIYSFAPRSDDPAPGPTIELDVTAVEDAGIREVLQTPGAAFGAWSILDALLAPTGPGSPFAFKQPLGQALEVKVALSGLFGRFVARAYLERYFELSIFAHLGSRTVYLDRSKRARIKRLVKKGDLPDWLACKSDLSSLTVAEAKGCHDPSGPAQALGRAWTQAGRIDVTVQGRKATVKRLAIATRWGVVSPKPVSAQLSVRDPIDEGEPLEPEEKDALFIGLLRLHIASMIEPLGHADLAQALRALTLQAFARRRQDEAIRARSILESSEVGETGLPGDTDDLVGGIVTRTGPISDAVTSTINHETLARLNLRPVFVGIERDVIRAAIDGEVHEIRSRMSKTSSRGGLARSDRAGGWVIPRGTERDRPATA
jgi:hypothetical protein